MRAFAILFVLYTCACDAQSLPTIDELLPRVQKNLDQFVSALPDFTCTEKAVSTRTVPGKPVRQVQIESVFQGLQQKSAGMAFQESRETVKRIGSTRGEFLFEGGFSSVLHETFASENGKYQTFSIAGEQVLDGRKTVIIAFATLENQRTLAIGWRGKRVVSKDSGRAWVDPSTAQVLRLQRLYTGLPSKITLDVTVDYADVTIAGKEYLMPKTVTAQVTSAGAKPDTSVYVAEYSNYRKFDVTSGIVPDRNP